MSPSLDPLDQLRESASFDFGEWLADLTYREIHAFVKGAGLALLGALAQSTIYWQVVALYALVVTGVVPRTGMVSTTAAQRREDHYFLGGVIAGSVLAAILGLDLV